MQKDSQSNILCVEISKMSSKAFTVKLSNSDMSFGLEPSHCEISMFFICQDKRITRYIILEITLLAGKKLTIDNKSNYELLGK